MFVRHVGNRPEGVVQRRLQGLDRFRFGSSELPLILLVLQGF